jgi:DNA-directed RNA polymerase subunit RPC12/RpoP
MALVKCPECGKEISTQAMSCPSCGYIINKTTVTIEATSKKWKALQFFGPLAMMLGIILPVIIASTTGEIGISGWYFSLILLGGGFVAFLIGKIGAWWYHG